MKNRSIGHRDPRLMPPTFVRSYIDPRRHEQEAEFREMRNRSIDHHDPHLMHQAFARSYFDPRQNEQEAEFREMGNRSIDHLDPRLMHQAFVRSYFDPIQNEQEAEFGEMGNRSIDYLDPRLMQQAFVKSYFDPRQNDQGQYPNRSIGRPNPRFMSQDFVRNYSDAGFPRQRLQIGEQAHGQPSDVLCIRHPPSVHVDGHGLYNAMIQFGEINWVRIFYYDNFSLVKFRSVEEAQRTIQGLQGNLFNDPRITIEYSSNEVSLDGYFMEYVPPTISPTTDYVPNENSFQPARTGMRDDNPDNYKWRGIITKCGKFICHARCSGTPFGQRMETKFPDIVNVSHKMELDKLIEHYVDAAVGFSVVFFLPDTESDAALYMEFMSHLSSNDRAWVAEFDGTTLFLVPPSGFLRNVLKVDGPELIYGVILKYAPQYIGLIASLSNFQPSSSMAGTVGAFASDC